MASTAKVLSSFQAEQATAERRLALVPAARRERGSRLGLLRDALGGALLLVLWLALWTVTWAAVAGPLSPATRGAASAAAQVSST